MTTRNSNSPTPLIWVSSIAIVLFSGVGIAAFMGWLPTSYGNQTSEPAALEAAESAPTKTIHKTPAQIAVDAPGNVTCAGCGVIESVQVINDVKKTSGIGLVGGAVVGGLLGNQVGGGRGKDVATVAGAVGGAVAGNAIEKNAGSTRRYEITVLFDDGSRRVFNEANPTSWQSGDRVRVVDGAIRSNG